MRIRRKIVLVSAASGIAAFAAGAVARCAPFDAVVAGAIAIGFSIRQAINLDNQVRGFLAAFDGVMRERRCDD